MYSQSTPVKHSAIIWVLVADGGRAKIYKYRRNKEVLPMRDTQRRPYDEIMKSHDLTLVPGMEFQAESLDNFKIAPRARGSFAGAQHASHSANEAQLDIHAEVKQNHVKAIAACLEQAREAKNFDHLVIAASPEILGALRLQLSTSVLQSTIGEIPKDFTNDQNHTLISHLQETLSEARVS